MNTKPLHRWISVRIGLCATRPYLDGVKFVDIEDPSHDNVLFLIDIEPSILGTLPLIAPVMVSSDLTNVVVYNWEMIPIPDLGVYWKRYAANKLPEGVRDGYNKHGLGVAFKVPIDV